jgi:DNA-binding MarR family transcriptional regulator
VRDLNRLLFLTSVINNRWDENIRVKLKHRGYTGIVPNHGPILKVISDNDKRVTVTELAESLVRPKPTITETLNKLEKLGYVARIKENEDKRVVYIHLTKIGIELNEFMSEEVESFLDNMLKDIEVSERRKLIELLSKCI